MRPNWETDWTDTPGNTYRRWCAGPGPNTDPEFVPDTTPRDRFLMDAAGGRSKR